MKHCAVLVVFLGLVGFSAQGRAAPAEVLPLAGESLRWSGEDPLEGPQAASARASTWASGEAGRRAAKNPQVIWASLPLPEGPWRAPALLLEGVSGTLELWLEGERVGRTVTSSDEVAAMRVLPLPMEALGRRVEVRILSSRFPPSLKTVSVGEESALAARLAREGFGAAASSLLMLTLAFCALMVWLLSREDRLPLRVFFFGLSSGLMAFGLGSASNLYVGELATQVVLRLGVAFFPWAVLSLVHAGFREQSHRSVPWLINIALGWGLLFLASSASEALLPVAGLSPFLFLLTVLFCVLVAWRAARAGNLDGWLLGGGYAFFLLVLFWDVLPLVGLRDTTGFHTHWSLMAMTLSFVGIFARRLMEGAKTQRLQARELERRELQSREVTVRLLTDASELLSAVAQLRESSTSQNQVIEKQASALQETQVTAEEIKRTSALAADKARSLLEQAVVADEAGRLGEQAVEESLAGISAIGVEVGSMAQAMGVTNQLAREIGEVVDVVKDLADQSNMLALNAAIEAVRSGEHGKGFAVVAREVRRLADQSLQATVRIREALERLGEGVRHSASAAERGEKSVADALERLRGSGEQLRTMSGILRETNASVRQISAAVTQQNAGIGQIFTAVQHLVEQMQEAVQRIQEAEAATLVVETVASRMSEAQDAA